MKIFKLAWIDFRNGAFRKWRYLIFFIVCLLCCNIFGIFSDNIVNEFQIHDIHFADCIAYLIQGTVSGSRLTSVNEFELSKMWMILLLFQLLIPLDYPVKSMELWGYPYLIHSSRKIWWNAKCIYTILVNLFTEVIKYLAIVLFCLIKGIELSLNNSNAFFEIIFGAARINFTEAFTTGQNLMILIIIPALAIMAMSMIQLFFSVWTHPVIAYLISVLGLVLSVFSIHPLLLGNYTMVIRSVLIDTDGLSISVEIIVCCLVITFVWLTGRWLIRRKDIFMMKKEG